MSIYPRARSIRESLVSVSASTGFSPSFNTSCILLMLLHKRQARTGVLIALIHSNCRDEPSKEAVITLNRSNELKEELTVECFLSHASS